MRLPRRTGRTWSVSRLLVAVQEDHEPAPVPHKIPVLSCTHSQALKFALSGTKEWSLVGAWLGLTPGQKPRKGCRKDNVEKDSSEAGIRARGDHENVTPLPGNSQKRGSGVLDLEGSRPWELYLQSPVSTSFSTVPAAKEQQEPQDHCQDADPYDPGPRDRQIHLGTEASPHIMIKHSSVFTGTLPAQNSTVQSPGHFPPHGTPSTHQASCTCIQGLLRYVPAGAMLTAMGPSTHVPGARGAVATDPYVDNIFIEAELPFLRDRFKPFSPTISPQKGSEN